MLKFPLKPYQTAGDYILDFRAPKTLELPGPDFLLTSHVFSHFDDMKQERV